MERLKQTEMARMSWCACDVFNLHGEIVGEPIMDSMFSDPHQDDDVVVIYPHDDPRGQRILEMPANDPRGQRMLEMPADGPRVKPNPTAPVDPTAPLDPFYQPQATPGDSMWLESPTPSSSPDTSVGSSLGSER